MSGTEQLEALMRALAAALVASILVSAIALGARYAGSAPTHQVRP